MNEPRESNSEEYHHIIIQQPELVEDENGDINEFSIIILSVRYIGIYKFIVSMI